MAPLDWNQTIADLRGPDIEKAVQAVERLSMQADVSHVADLYQLLRDEDFFIREAAADPLARLEGPRALPALLEAMTRGVQDGHDNDGLSATVADLLECHAAEVAPLLLTLLDAPEPDVRAHAAWALGYVAAEIAPDPLLRALQDETAAVRADVAGALGSFPGDPLVVDALLASLADPVATVRASALSALGALGDVRAIPAVRAALQDPGEEVRQVAAYALQRLAPGSVG